MARPSYVRPDVLVLAAGGVLGEAWMQGVLAGLEDRGGARFGDVEGLVGTSAGSIVAAQIAAGEPLRRPPGAKTGSGGPGREQSGARRRSGAQRAARGAAALAGGAAAPMAQLAVNATARGGALARAALLARLPRGKMRLDDLREGVKRSGATFDGRLRVCAVDRRSGRRVVFGAPGAPAATVADAVVASCAIPGVFAPVTIGGREYVDGGVWSATNLDAAPAGRDTHVLCLDPTATIAHMATPQGAMRQAFRVTAAVEMTVLRRRGAKVWRFGPDRDCGELMGRDLMDRAPVVRVLAAGYRQGLALSER